MYITFSKRKANYKRGQLAPFFIALIAVLIIAVFVTINVGKISLIKTRTANAADAGALAGGSVMASVFNGQAGMNSQMIDQYEMFFASISVSFTLALVFLIMANVKASAGLTAATSASDLACPSPCVAKVAAETAAAAIGSALGKLETFITTMRGIIVAVTGFWIAQLFFYLIMRNQAKKGRVSAIEMAYRYSFINSGIRNKLVSSNPAEVENKRGDIYNYTDTFSDFIDGISGDPPSLEYHWKDGQDRHHRVKVEAGTEKVDTYRLRATVLPFPAEMITLGIMLRLAHTAHTALTLAETKYTFAVPVLATACGCRNCCSPSSHPCCLCWAAACADAEEFLGAGIAANTEGISNIVPIYPLLALAWTGLAPGEEFTDSSGWSSAWAILCWVEDIVHDRLFHLTEWQAHQGEDYGLWKTKYPNDWNGSSEPSANERIRSYSRVNFRGHGKINPPEPYFDASIQAAE